MGCKQSIENVEKNTTVATTLSNELEVMSESDDSNSRINHSLSPQDIAAEEKEVEIIDSPQLMYSKDVLAAVQIPWNEIKISGEKKSILGTGSSGVVVRGIWTPKDNNMSPCDVAIKIFLQSEINITKNEYKMMCSLAFEELKVMKLTEKQIGSSEYIVKAYGLLMGQLPTELKIEFGNHNLSLSGVGIVMRNEIGGSLSKYVERSINPFLSTFDKLKILMLLAKALTKLHKVNIVHADIKPANILLGSKDFNRVRLADFGLSIVRCRKANVLKSTLAMTQETKGTPIYYAPEMLVDPYHFEVCNNDSINDKGESVKKNEVARPSRKTDMYAFALVCWQTLSQEQIFPDITTEVVLAARIHQGYRPPLHLIPVDTPLPVVELMVNCWDKDRSKRLTAAQAHATLKKSLKLFINNHQ